MFTYSLNSLIVFYEVVKHGSFSRAAEVLAMTQPGVSNHVKQLEAQTGWRLLKREKNGFKLTKEGKMVLRHAARMESAARELDNEIALLKRNVKPVLRLGTTHVYSDLMMPSLLQSFEKANPHITIKVDTGSSGDMMNSLLSMENDIVVVANQRTSAKLASIPLVREELAIITSRAHKFAGRESLSLRELEACPIVIREEGSSTRAVFLAAFESMGIRPPVTIDMKSTEFIKQWVSRGHDMSVLIKRAVRNEEHKYLKVIPLQEKLFLDVRLVFLKARKHDPTIHAFVRYIEELKSSFLLQEYTGTASP